MKVYLFSFLLSLFQVHAENIKLEDLPRLDIDKSRVTVSGISSGSFFASQFHLAHSNLVQGVALVAGGLYWCAEGSAERAQKICMSQPEQINIKNSIDKAKEQEQLGLINLLANLKNDRIYIFAAPNDTVVKQAHAKFIEEFYSHFGDKDLILRVTHPKASHAFLTTNFGNSCGKNGMPWIQDCDFNMAEQILQHLDPLPNIKSKRVLQTQTLYFNQSPFAKGPEQLYPWGGLYIPETCKTQKCGLHVAFHGCQMNPSFIKTQFIEQAGYQQAAELHNLVILFPQASTGKNNPFGCWDWYGIHGNDYINQNGPQIEAVYNIIQALMK